MTILMEPEQSLGKKSVASAKSTHVSRKELLKRLAVAPEVYEEVRQAFPVRWPRYYLDLTTGPDHPISLMGRPSRAELALDPGDLADPVSDRLLRPHPFIVRKHADRVIILTTKKCHFYCRFCFRREEPFQQAGEPSASDWQQIFAFLAANPEIEEPILSGGDPLTLTDSQLFAIKEGFERIASIKRWRIHSRAPVHFPERITPALVQGLAGGTPLRLVSHYNHVSEVTPETARISRLFAQAQIPLLNQAVLLAGVNDDVQSQLELWRELRTHGILPHYLHHPDRVAGNAAFRVTLKRGRDLFAQLCNQLEAPRPKYVIDLPDGRGKVPVQDLFQKDAEHWTYTFPDGTLSTYRDWKAEPL